MSLIQNTLRPMKYFDLATEAAHTPPPAPQGIISAPPPWIWLQREDRGKAGKGEEGQNEIPREGCVSCMSLMCWCLFRSNLRFGTLTAKYILRDLKESFQLHIISWDWLRSTAFLTTDFEAVNLFLLWRFRQDLSVRHVKSPSSFFFSFFSLFWSALPMWIVSLPALVANSTLSFCAPGLLVGLGNAVC